MQSVGILGEELKLNTPVSAPHIIPYSSYSPPLLPQVSNPAADIHLVSENDRIEVKKNGAKYMVLLDKGVK